MQNSELGITASDKQCLMFFFHSSVQCEEVTQSTN